MIENVKKPTKTELKKRLKVHKEHQKGMRERFVAFESERKARLDSKKKATKKGKR